MFSETYIMTYILMIVALLKVFKVFWTESSLP